MYTVSQWIEKAKIELEKQELKENKILITWLKYKIEQWKKLPPDKELK